MRCTTTVDELLAYWLGELDEAEALRLEEHWFTCAACTERLEAIVTLGAAIRRGLVRGEFGFVAPIAFVQKIKESGLRVREYDLEPGGAVSCTITSEDDLVVSYLRARLGDVRRLDIEIDDSTTGKHRVTDVAFDPASGGLTFVPSAAHLRTLGPTQQRVRLVAVEGADERVIADYTFNHSPS